MNQDFIHRVVTETFDILEGRLPSDDRDPEYGIPEENCHIVLCEDIEEVMAKGKLNEKIQELFNS